MRGGSPFQTLLLLVVAVSAGLGVYFLHDHLDLVRQQDARMQETMREMNRELRLLRESAESGALAVRPAGPAAGAADGAAPQSASAKFANADLRPAEAVDGGRRTTSDIAFPGNLNNIANNEATVGSLWALCNDSLAERNYADVERFEPKLAQSWEVSEDGLTWTIHLRRGALWHPYTDPLTRERVASKEVTSDDFVFFWETIHNTDIPGTEVLRSYYEFCKGIEKVDDHTFRVIWKEPYSLIETWTLGLSPLPKHYYRPDDSNWTDKEFARQMESSPRNQHIVGCGAYMLDRFEKGRDIRLVRFEGYYGPKPFIAERLIREIKDPEISLNELKKGGLDAISLQPEQWVKQSPEPEFFTVTPDPKTAIEDSAEFARKKIAGEAPDDHTYEKFTYLSNAYSYIGYNMTRPLFQDRTVRLALTHLVDRQRILREVYYDLGQIVTGPFVPTNPAYVHDVEPFPFDVEKAKQLLKEAGWEDTDKDGLIDKDLDGDGKREAFTFTFMTIANHPQQRKYVPIIQQDMARAGIKMEIKPAEWSVYTEFLNERNFDVCSLGWSVPITTDPYQVWHSSQTVGHGSNHVGYKSAKADELIEQGRREMDPEKRKAIYQEFFRLLHHDQPYTFLFCPAARVAQHKRFYNARVFAQGMQADIMYVPQKYQQIQP